MLSVIVPIFNEAENLMLKRSLRTFKQAQESGIPMEFLFVDSGSRDQTHQDIYSYGLENLQIIKSDTNSRARRLNIGLENSEGEVLILNHPRSVLEFNAFKFLHDNPQEGWGGFTHEFDLDHPLLRFTSWYSNEVRGKRAGVFYLDHCFFMSRRMYQKIGKMPEVDIFEDTELSLLLRAHSHPKILPFKSTTSAKRFEKNGIYFQAGMNQLLKIGYHLGINDKLMNKIYEKGLSLNSKYKGS